MSGSTSSSPWETKVNVYLCLRCGHSGRTKLLLGPAKCGRCQSRKWWAPRPVAPRRVCLHCGNRWEGCRPGRPACCPRCKSYNWDCRPLVKHRTMEARARMAARPKK